MVAAVTLNVGVGLLLAVLINRHMPSFLRYFFRTAYFFPVLVALAYSAIIWQYLYQKDTGIINYYLHFLNIDPIPWLSSPLWVMPSIIIMDVGDIRVSPCWSFWRVCKASRRTITSDPCWTVRTAGSHSGTSRCR